LRLIKAYCTALYARIQVNSGGNAMARGRSQCKGVSITLSPDNLI
jgi:hypothetical protein